MRIKFTKNHPDAVMPILTIVRGLPGLTCPTGLSQGVLPLFKKEAE